MVALLGRHNALCLLEKGRSNSLLRLDGMCGMRANVPKRVRLNDRAHRLKLAEPTALIVRRFSGHSREAPLS